MSLTYDHLVGREFVYGSVDCYGLVRDFYRDNFSIELTDYARPVDFWDHGLDLYNDNYYREGFRVLECHPAEWQPGDCFLMAIKSQIANHAAVLLPKGKILHHFIGRRSVVEDYRGLWRNTTTHVLRHKDVVLDREESTANLMELLPNAVREKFVRLSEGAGGPDTE